MEPILNIRIQGEYSRDAVNPTVEVVVFGHSWPLEDFEVLIETLTLVLRQARKLGPLG